MAGKKWAYLATELEVHHDDGDLSTGHHQDEKDHEEKPKQIVELILPNCLLQKKQKRQIIDKIK